MAKAKKDVINETEVIENTTSLFPIEVTYTDLNGNEQTIHMKSEISLAEEYALLNSAVDSVISEDMGYQPMWTEYSLRCEVLNYFTDYKLSDDINENHNIIMKADLFGKVVDKIEDSYEQIKDYVTAMIEHKKQCLANKSQLDFLCSDIRNLVSEYSSKVDDKDIKNIKKFLKNIANSKINWETVFNTMLQKQQKSGVTNNVVNLNPKE